MKILTIDIETAPNLVYSWGLWNQNIAINQIKEPGYVLCWGAKWYNDDSLYYSSLHEDGRESMLEGAYELLEEADVLVHYNGTYFDIPTLNREFILQGWSMPAPSQHVDLLTTVRKQFKFPSNKLAYVGHALGVGAKPASFNMDLWRACMNGDDAAWKEMEKYNLNDVELTEQVYDALKPWIKSHPNHGLYSGSGFVCPHCGSENVQKRGVQRTKVLTYQRYQCTDCGAWSQERRRDKDAVANKLKGVT